MSASDDAWRCAARAAARCEVMVKFRVLCCGFDVVVVEKSFIYMYLLLIVQAESSKVHVERCGR